MHGQYVKNVVEAALLAAGRPLSLAQLAEIFEERERPTPDEVRAALQALSGDYAERGIELKEVASGFRVQVRRAMTEPVSRLWQERPPRYSRAMLETIALIAYRQPITRGEIEEIRGVAVNPNILRTLMERSWVRVVGHREVPGHPELLGTTREFLDYFNLRSLDDLPTLAALRDMDNVGVQLELTGDDMAGAGVESGAGQDAGGSGDDSLSASAEDEGDDEESGGGQVRQNPGLVARRWDDDDCYR
ncbi:MAG: SMC-Scp complex subunit ScpB [Gammaproteobacteria bacterium]|nr:SMC-Scp complex subunit ScpB [Gammaproteobacteria bacterium]